MAYQSVVLGVLLYGAETWGPTQEMVNKLNRFHRYCVHCIVGVSRTMQWREHLTTEELTGRFGTVQSIGDLLIQWRLRWLGHAARMSDMRYPKCLLFVCMASSEVSHLWR